jgi:hypothetical protein
VISTLALSLHSNVSPHGKTDSVKIRIEKSNQKFFIVANVILLNYKFSFLQDFLCGSCSSRVSYNVSQLGEVADLEALTFNLALMFI